MPLYEFKCKKCGKITSVVFSYKDYETKQYDIVCKDKDCNGETKRHITNTHFKIDRRFY